MLFRTEPCPDCKRATNLTAGGSVLGVILKCSCGGRILTAKPVEPDNPGPDVVELVAASIRNRDSGPAKAAPGPRSAKRYRFVNTSPSNDCCDRHADNQGCDCDLDEIEAERAEVARQDARSALEKAGLIVDPDLFDRLFPGPTGCGICRDPNCYDPNGKH